MANPIATGKVNPGGLTVDENKRAHITNMTITSGGSPPPPPTAANPYRVKNADDASWLAMVNLITSSIGTGTPLTLEFQLVSATNIEVISITVSPTPTIPVPPTPAYQLTVIVVPTSDSSTLNVWVTTSNNYQDHANPQRQITGATIDTTMRTTFKIPENQGRSLTVCIDSGFLSQRKCQVYAATGKDMSVTLYAP